jgi:putrescine transport system permease protein
MSATTLASATAAATAAPSTAAPQRRRQRPEAMRSAMAVWTVLVLTFMFIPILLVILHSFNKGGNFVIWSKATSTKWWGDVFDGPKVWAFVFRFAAIIAIVYVIARVLDRVVSGVPSAVRRWALPVGFALAVIVNARMTKNYQDLFDNRPLGDAMRNSFASAIIATTLAVVLGGLAGVALARRPGKWASAFMIVLFLVLVTPEIMDAVALLGWFARIGEFPLLGMFKNGFVRIAIGQSLYASAVVTLIVRARLVGLDESLEEAAADLGAPPARAFRQITLPLISSALLAGGLLSFTLCLDNTIITGAVSTAGSSTFTTFVVGASRSQLRPSIGVGAVVLMGVTLAALAFVGVVLKRSGESSSQIAATMTGA